MHTNLRWNSFDAEFYLSSHRLGTFAHREDLYRYNLMLSEAFYTPLALFEVVLRNAIHNSLVRHFKRDDWWESLRSEPKARYLLSEIDKVIRSSGSKHTHVSAVIAELNFGFWTGLFDTCYERILWKPLRLIFTGLHKDQRQATTIRKLLKNIRLFRNRVYHYEPVLYKQPAKIHGDINTLLGWIAPGAVEWMKTVDRVPEVIAQKEGRQ